MEPQVSIIIPNYNYLRFLEKRVDSIINQTFKNYEIIFLDDASTDDSMAFFDQYMAHHPEISFVKKINSENSGNPFVQWNKGVRLAKGEYVWIAEADDYCDSHFLETLVSVLDKNPNVGVGYCQSCHVNEKDENLGSIIWSVEWLDSERWKHDFINKGRDEIENYLLFQNTIPNASAILFRRTLFEKIGQAPVQYKLMGDWLTWIRMLSISDVAFIAHEHNSFRVHEKSVRSEFDGQKRLAYVRELYSFALECSKIIDPSKERINQLKDHYARCTFHKLRGEGILKMAYFQLMYGILRFDPFFFFRFLKLFRQRAV